MGNTYTILIRKREGKRIRMRPRCGREHNIKMDLTETLLHIRYFNIYYFAHCLISKAGRHAVGNNHFFQNLYSIDYN